MDNSGSFDPIAPLLPREFHFVAVDLPGHGFSSHKPNGLFYNSADYWTDVHRIVDYLQWKDFSFICHSKGVPIGLGYTACHPERVKKFIALDGSRFVCVPLENTADTMRTRIMKMLDLELKLDDPPRPLKIQDAIEVLIRATDGSLNEESAKVMLKRGSKQVDDERVIFTRDPRVRIASLLHVSHKQSLSLARKISCELLLIECTRGILRVIVPHDDVQELIEAFKTSAKRFEHVIVEGTHHAHVNNPEIIASHVNKFLCTS